MKYCKECGTQLKENIAFCTNCGTQQPSAQGPSEQAKQNQPIQHPKIPMNRRKKLKIFVAIILLLGLYGGYKGLEAYYDPLKKLEAMDEAIITDNVEQFMQHIEFVDEAFLDEQSYFDYISDYKWDSVRSQYESIIYNQNEFSTKITEMGSGIPIFTLRPTQHFLGLFQSYTLYATPVNVLASASMDDVNLEVLDHSEKISSKDTSRLSFYPGSYLITGKAKNDYGAFTYENKFDITSQNDHELYLDFEGNTYRISTNQWNASLFMNDKDTGQTLGDIEHIGPIPSDSKINMHAEWENNDGDLIKSDAISLNDEGLGGSLTFLFEDTENVSTIEDPAFFILKFRDSYEDALNNKDYNEIEPYLKSGSHAAKDLKEYIGDLKDTAYHYDFTATETNDVTAVSENEIEITTREEFIFTNHLDEETYYDRDKVYTVELHGDDYQITYIDYVDTKRDN